MMSRFIAYLLVALSLGLAWAVRGHFGHEWGACWAGAIGAGAVLTAARRYDWSLRLPSLVAIGGIGWAIGGMMSYGLLVGYGRGTDFGNVYYGLCMLAVVGGLYGFLGGGMLGLGLESTEERSPAWASLITEMVAGGVLGWGFLIYQCEWLMTPPRSELWAACLGAAVALGWHLFQHGYFRALRVAAYSAVGAGLGFAAGNFFQTLGSTSELAFNWWNVMEFTLGFCGGLGMAYGVFTTDWPPSVGPSRLANALALLFLAFAVPATNLVHAFHPEELLLLAQQQEHPSPMSLAQMQINLGWFGILAFLLVSVTFWRLMRSDDQLRTNLYVPGFFILYTLFFIIFGHLKKGVFLQPVGTQLEQYLYWVLLIVIVLAVIFRIWKQMLFPMVVEHPESIRRWIIIVLTLLALLGVMSLVSVNLHDGLPGAKYRFQPVPTTVPVLIDQPG
jgi:hypothetical protein